MQMSGTNAEQTSSRAEIADEAHRYALFSTDGSFRLRLQLNDEGVSPGPDRLAFMRDGIWQSRAYSEIATVNIHINSIRGSQTIGMCVVNFRDRAKLLITTSNASGLSTGARDRDFRTFLVDFHRRLIASGAAGGISFWSGFSETRSRILMGSLIAAAAMFLVLPLLLLLVTGEPKMLYAMFMGVMLVVPAANLVGPNRPRSYSPQEPPDLLS